MGCQPGPAAEAPPPKDNPAPIAGCVAHCWLQGAQEHSKPLEDSEWFGLWEACVANVRSSCCYDDLGFRTCSQPWEKRDLPQPPRAEAPPEAPPEESAP